MVTFPNLFVAFFDHFCLSLRHTRSFPQHTTSPSIATTVFLSETGGTSLVLHHTFPPPSTRYNMCFSTCMGHVGSSFSIRPNPVEQLLREWLKKTSCSSEGVPASSPDGGEVEDGSRSAAEPVNLKSDSWIHELLIPRILAEIDSGLDPQQSPLLQQLQKLLKPKKMGCLEQYRPNGARAKVRNTAFAPTSRGDGEKNCSMAGFPLLPSSSVPLPAGRFLGSLRCSWDGRRRSFGSVWEGWGSL